MPDQHGVGAECLCRDSERGVARLTGCSFRAFATGSVNPDPMRFESGPKGRGDPFAVDQPIVRYCVQAMVHMYRQRCAGAKIASDCARDLE
jgi:hypothetical protein